MRKNYNKDTEPREGLARFVIGTLSKVYDRIRYGEPGELDTVYEEIREACSNLFVKYGDHSSLNGHRIVAESNLTFWEIDEDGMEIFYTVKSSPEGGFVIEWVRFLIQSSEDPEEVRTVVVAIDDNGATKKTGYGDERYQVGTDVNIRPKPKFRKSRKLDIRYAKKLASTLSDPEASGLVLVA